MNMDLPSITNFLCAPFLKLDDISVQSLGCLRSAKCQQNNSLFEANAEAKAKETTQNMFDSSICLFHVLATANEPCKVLEISVCVIIPRDMQHTLSVQMSEHVTTVSSP